MAKLVGMSDCNRVAGEYHPAAKLTDRQVDEIRALHEDEGVPYRAIAARFGLPKSTVSGICQYKRRATTYVTWRPARAASATHASAGA